MTPPTHLYRLPRFVCGMEGEGRGNAAPLATRFYKNGRCTLAPFPLLCPVK